MEAVIGAIYLDGGMEPARTYIHRFILSDLENKQLFLDSKTNLQEYMQQNLKKNFITGLWKSPVPSTTRYSWWKW